MTALIHNPENAFTTNLGPENLFVGIPIVNNGLPVVVAVALIEIRVGTKVGTQDFFVRKSLKNQ